MRTEQIDKYTWETAGHLATNIMTKTDVEIRQGVIRPELHVVIMTERKDNPGASITNCFEFLATKIKEQRLAKVKPESILWVEHYPKDDYRQEDEYCLVRMGHDGKKYYHPEFAPIPPEQLAGVIYQDDNPTFTKH